MFNHLFTRHLPMLLCGISILLSGPFAFGQSQMDIMKYWAPEVYHDINTSGGMRQYYGARDAMLTVNFDGDWYTGNNWNNSHFQTWEQGQLSDRLTPPMYGAAYSSMVETQKFFFITYGYYHTGDDSNLSADRHENDWEGLTICIRKDGTSYGQFQAAVAEFHKEKRPYIASEFQWSGSHPKIYISANGNFDLTSTSKHGHGVETFTNTGYQPNMGNDGIVYQVDDYADNVLAVDIPGTDNWTNARRYKYKLIHLNELWNRRGNQNLYRNYTELRGGVSSIDDGGTLPWEREYYRSPITYFQSIDKFNFLDSQLSTDAYTFNPYYNNVNTQTGNANPGEILPALAGWSKTAIGGQGKAYVDRGTYVLDGQGADIWGTSDQFYFVYKRLTGDGEIVTKLHTVQQIDAYTKAGVMVRETLSGNAKNAFLFARPGVQAFVQTRTDVGGATAYIANNQPISNRAIYLKLKRQGNVFTFLTSYDGTNYTQIGTQTISMTAAVYMGLALTSHNSAEFASATFDNVATMGATTASRLASVSTDHQAVNLFAYSNKLVIQSNDPELLSQQALYVFNLQGQPVLTAQLTNASIQEYDLAPGLYIAKVVDKNHQLHIRKIIVR